MFRREAKLRCVRFLPRLATFVLFLLAVSCRTQVGSGGAASDYYDLGVYFFGQKDYARSVQYFQKSLAADPTQVGTQFNLAQAMIMKGDFQSADPLLSRLAGLDPDNMLVAESRAYSLAMQGKLDAAFTDYKKVAEKTGIRNSVYYNLSIIGQKLGKTEETYPYVKDLVTLKPSDGPSLRLAGEMALALKKENDAQDFLARYAVAMKADPAVLRTIAADYEQYAYYARALAVWNQLIDANAQDGQAWFGQGRVLALHGDDASRAKSSLQRAVELKYTDSKAWTSFIAELPEGQKDQYSAIISAADPKFGASPTPSGAPAGPASQLVPPATTNGPGPSQSP